MTICISLSLSLSFPFSILVSKSYNQLIGNSVSQPNSHSNLMVYNALTDSFIRLGIEYIYFSKLWVAAACSVVRVLRL
jgi:hypothetical protein